MRWFLAIGLAYVAAFSHANTILILGDSISAAYGIDKQEGWVSLLEVKLLNQCERITVKNASVSGETTAGGLSRLPALLRETNPSLVLIELGANDGLRGLSPKAMQNNLQRMIQLSKDAAADVVVLGMYMPSNYGPAYRAMFNQAFVEASQAEQVRLQPFFLDKIFDRPNMMQKDGMHPTAAAQPQLLENAWQVMADDIQTLCSTRVEK